MENLQQLFECAVRDLYSAEKQFLRSLPKLLKVTTNAQLKVTIEDYIGQTEIRISRIRRVCNLGGFRPLGKTCMGAAGLIDEAWEVIECCAPGSTMDAAIISCLQKVERYEICAFGTVLGWAEALGNRMAVNLLRQTIEEARKDELLSAIAEEVNKSAAQGLSIQLNTRKRNGVEATS